MTTFLQQVAKDLISKYGANLSRVAVVFPNKRASLFLNEELILQNEGSAVWAPQYLTISELFREESNLVVADKIQLICELYKHYTRITKSSESLDEFYGWGEMMLADFDDLDKNMGNAEKIFENTSDLHSYDDDEFLTPEQKDTLRRFFRNINGAESQLKENFLKLWNNLGTIYAEYKKALFGQGIAYEGMLYRDVIEKNGLTDSCVPEKTNRDSYVFVGFNLLQKVEQNLFERLAKENRAKFYWDYDTYYMSDNNEAGKYIKRLMKAFPNEIAPAPIYDNLRHIPSITYMSASTDDIQARYISQWLTPERINAGKRTAIILGDEKLLPTVIHCLPESVENVNITTGYPLSQTLSATLVKQYFDLKLTGYSFKRGALRLHSVNNILRHPYLRHVSENAIPLMKELNENHVYYPTISELSRDEYLKLLFTPLTSEQEKDNVTRNKTILSHLISIFQRIAINYKKEIDEYNNTVTDNGESIKKDPDPLTQESIYRMYQILNRVNALAESGELDVDTVTLQGLLNQIIRTDSVPFHGEPIIGIQIMGVLETRNLDFDHILVLSCNEGNLPKGVNDASFIPHALRHAYELTTIENKIAIYAYYFHRMIQRCTDITLTYNNATNDTRTNEMSRFMMQLMAESDIHIDKKNLTSDLCVSQSTISEIPKTKEIISIMDKMNYISPTAINDYLRCQLQFFYKNICNIKDNSDTDEEELDAPTFGSIFHSAAQEIYRQWEGKRQLVKEDIKAMLDDKSYIHRAIEKGFREVLFKFPEEDRRRPTPKLDGTQTVYFNIIERLLKSLLTYDMKHTPLRIIELETRCHRDISFTDSNGNERTISIGGIIDRLDSVIDADGQEHIRIVDYKTGSGNVKSYNIKSLDDVFSSDAKALKAHSGYYLQTMLYAYSKLKKDDSKFDVSKLRISPALLYPHYSRAEDYDPILCIDKQPITDFHEYADEYEKQMQALLHSIFNYRETFHPTDNTDNCKKCAYANFCGKTKIAN